MSQEELEKKVRESGTIFERLNQCRERIGKMCSERRPPRMTIPVQWDDDDFFISTTLKDAADHLQAAVELVAIREEQIGEFLEEKEKRNQ